jgi:hypothetical protein
MVLLLKNNYPKCRNVAHWSCGVCEHIYVIFMNVYTWNVSITYMCWTMLSDATRNVIPIYPSNEILDL